jgi:acyl-CoA synthetase (AMP-forming)/AMP-acid ligase II
MVSLDMMYDNVFLKIVDQVKSLELVLTAGVFDFLFEESASPSSVPEGKEGISSLDFCRAYPPEAPSLDLSLEDEAYILYTGGTTGTPKGAVLTNGSVLANLAQHNAWVKMQKGAKRNLAAFAREKLSPYKVPKMIEIVAAMPLTSVGKVDKKALRV